MTDNTTSPRPMDADINPVGWIARARAANRAKRYRENHPEYIERKRQRDANRKGVAANPLRVSLILAAAL
jgi:hypothetical protein